MRILLISPKQQGRIKTNLPLFVDQERGALPPLGLLYVATCAKLMGCTVKVMDMSIEQEPISRAIPDFKPDIVGITATTLTMLEALEIAREVRTNCKAKIVFGGIHPSIYPEETANLPEVDSVVCGEGEHSFISWLKNPSEKIIKANDFINDLDSLPFPDRTLTNYKAYSSILGSNGYVTTMITSRGCPYHCIFCHRPHLGKKFRARSAESIIEEMWIIRGLGIREVLIYDDTFTIDKERILRLCRYMVDQRIDLVFDIRSRVDTIDEDMLWALEEAGCKRIHYGIEASSPEILKNICKEITLEQAERAIKLTKKHNIETLAYFILGNPGEKISDIEQTIKYAQRLDPDYCHFAIMTPYPETPLYKMWLKNHPDHWQDFAEKPYEIDTPYWDEIDREVLIRLLGKAYREFYWRPKQVIREIAKTKSLGEIAKKSRSAIKILERRQ